MSPTGRLMRAAPIAMRAVPTRNAVTTSTGTTGIRGTRLRPPGLAPGDEWDGCLRDGGESPPGGVQRDERGDVPLGPLAAPHPPAVTDRLGRGVTEGVGEDRVTQVPEPAL